MAKEIKNYLKSVKDITAPLNWKSAPDSPPTQLAYITQPEIDLLVKANIHGSMNGKPNKGPKGIMSLDGLGEEDTAYDDAVDKSGNEAAIDSYYGKKTHQRTQRNLMSFFGAPEAESVSEEQKMDGKKDDNNGPAPII